MNAHTALTPRRPDDKLNSVIKLAILAVGGQGGGVLTGWIEALARSEGYACQATSVAGVAQRTGSTIYYIEMAPAGEAQPVFSLAPAAGDVDVMISAEMMEAGRAIMRGFVTPDRTTLIASTHRALAVSEKATPGNGVASSEEVRAAAEIAAEQLVMFDMNATALANGSVISSALFGALAGSGALPFPREAYEDAIRASGKGVEASLRSFSAAFDQAKSGAVDAAEAPAVSEPGISGPDGLMSEWEKLTQRSANFPAPVREMALTGLRKVVGFQDIAYGGEYLDRLSGFLKEDSAAHDYLLSREAAKYIANAMAYDDVINVADRKTRASRFARIEREMKAGDDTMRLTDFFHPRAEEITGMLPARIGARVERSDRAMRIIGRLFGKGRRIRTDRLSGFLMLWLIGGLRGWRRGTLRHRQERAHLDAWQNHALAMVPKDYAVAVELIRCRRLIKGYSDTHARSFSKYDRVMSAASLLTGRDDAADWIARLREAALQDEKGEALDGAVKTIKSFI